MPSLRTLTFVSAVLCALPMLPQAAGTCGGAPAAAPGMAFPDTPAGRLMRTWVDNYNAGDGERIARFAREHFSPQLLKETTPEQCAQLDRQGRSQTGTMALQSQEVSANGTLKAVLANAVRTMGLEIQIRVDPGAPDRIEDFDVRLVRMGPAPGGAGMPATAPATRLTPALRAELVQAALAQLEESYVDEAAARRIGGHLRQRMASGAYDALENPSQFAEVLTQDLQAINGDLHLTLGFSPKPPAPGARPGFDPFAGAPQRNFGLTRVEILEGNIGYLETTGFLQGEGFQKAVADALDLLGRTEAVIIDLRRNGGGGGQMGALLYSHFLGPEPQTTLLVRSRRTPEPFPERSLAQVPGPRRPDVPLYVLTSQGTGSAAEAFAFVLKNLKRATIVGTRTAGAGRMVAFPYLGHGFTLGCSITQVTEPSTGAEWERVGVQPDVTVPAEQALAEAHLAALRGLRAKAQDPVKGRTLERLAAMAEARRQPRPLDPKQAARFVGTYEGRVVSLAEGRLGLGRNAGALKEPLVHLEGSRFALGSTLYTFEEQEGRLALVQEGADGQRVVWARSHDAR